MTITVASGTSTPTSITVVATSTSTLTGPELGHDPLLLGRRQLAVEEADAQAGQLGPGQAFGFGHHRRGLDPVRPLDQRAHHEGPVPARHLGPAPAPTPRRPLAGPLSQVVVTGSRPGGSSSMMVMSRSPKTTMAAVRGMGVAVITSRSGSRPWPSAPRPLARRAARCSTPKRCCSSMTTTPRERKPTRSVRRAWVPIRRSTEPSARPAWRAVRSAAPVLLVSRATRSGRRPSERRRVGHREALDQPGHLGGVLLGQHLGGGHQRALVAALHRHQHGGHRHHRLARADVALEQPVHGERAGQIAADGLHGPALGLGRA